MLNKKFTYIVPVHNIISLKNYVNFCQNDDILKDINFKYVCSVNPDKTDVYNQKDINVINIWNKDDPYMINNKILRFKSTLMYYLKNKHLIDTEYLCIEACTCYIKERHLLNNVKNDTLYTRIRKSKDFFNGHPEYDYNKMNEYYKKYFNYNSNINTDFFLFDYCIIHKDLFDTVYQFLKYYIDILIQNYPPPKVFVSEFFDCCLYYNYINSNWKTKFNVKHIGFNFHTFGRRPGLHFYGG